MARLARTGYPKVEVEERWNGCKLVNPLCPDDLCWLPVEEGKQYHLLHCLGTDRWCDRFTLSDRPAMYLSETAETQRDLIKEGAEKQWELFGDWREDGTVDGPGLIHPKPAKYRTRRKSRSTPREDPPEPADPGSRVAQLQRRLSMLVRGDDN